jgi:hypothetical protein
MLTAYGAVDFVLPRLAALSSGNTAGDGDGFERLLAGSKAVRIAMGYVLFLAFLGAFSYDLSLAHYTVPSSSQAAMQWIRANTPTGSRFLVLTGRPDPFSDPSTEWFPLIALRTSENTIQGQEWTMAGRFMPFLSGIASLQACLNADPACMEGWADSHQLPFDYVYLEKAAGKDALEPSGLLLFQLRQDPRYGLVFENAGAVVFKKK